MFRTVSEDRRHTTAGVPQGRRLVPGPNVSGQTSAAGKCAVWGVSSCRQSSFVLLGCASDTVDLPRTVSSSLSRRELQHHPDHEQRDGDPTPAPGGEPVAMVYPHRAMDSLC